MFWRDGVALAQFDQLLEQIYASGREIQHLFVNQHGVNKGTWYKFVDAIMNKTVFGSGAKDATIKKLPNGDISKMLNEHRSHVMKDILQSGLFGLVFMKLSQKCGTM